MLEAGLAVVVAQLAADRQTLQDERAGMLIALQDERTDMLRAVRDERAVSAAKKSWRIKIAVIFYGVSSLSRAPPMVRAAATPPVASNVARPVQNEMFLGLIGLTIAHWGDSRGSHERAHLHYCHEDQKKFDSGTTPFCSHLKDIISAHRERQTFLVAFPTLAAEYEGLELEEYLAMTARQMLDDLHESGDVEGYVGFEQPAWTYEPIKYDEGEGIDYIANAQFQKLSQPVVLQIVPARGLPPLFSLRAFVYRLPTTPRNVPILLGGHRVVEFDGAPGASPAFLSIYDDLDRNQRDEARFQLAAHYRVLYWVITPTRTQRTAQGPVFVIAINTNLPGLARSLGRGELGMAKDIGPLGLRGIISSETRAIAQAVEARERHR